MTTQAGQTKTVQAGSNWIDGGLLMAAVGLVLFLLVGFSYVALLLPVGLILAAIGFGQRVLYALEHKPATSD